MRILVSYLAVLFLDLLSAPLCHSQFIDEFSGDSLLQDPRGVHGWTYFTGDGDASMRFTVSGTGYASIIVDASTDSRGIWWAFIRRRVSKHMDLQRLHDRRYALRIEARIKSSEAPRRVNLHLNTQRTTDFHSHLMEFDIPDTAEWHTISMTTRGFDAVPGDSVYGQLALMDWGFGRYRVDLDYFKVDVVNVDSVGPDLGTQVPYHPPIPDVRTFSEHIPVTHDCTIDSRFPAMNFNSWASRDENAATTLVAVNGTQYAILRWDLSAYKGRVVAGSGILELTTSNVEHFLEYSKDFGMVRITEILAGDPHWDQAVVTEQTLCGGSAPTDVLNPQMIIDVRVAEGRGAQTFATISRPVLQRLMDGKTLGLAIRPLGAISASFYAVENHDEVLAAKLHCTFVFDTSTLQR